MKYTLESTDTFDIWFAEIDKGVKNRVLSRFARVENGNFGDHKELEEGLFELRFFFNSGLRVYYTIRHDAIVLLLAGGNKASQKADIVCARGLLAELED
jgi:putative addiction module killer protein